MPQHASAKKRMKTNARDRAKNRAVKSEVRRATQDLREAIGTEEAPEKLRVVFKELDKAAKKRVLPNATANRRKARLAAAVHKAAESK